MEQEGEEKPRSKPVRVLWGIAAIIEVIDLLVYGTFGLGVLFASILKVVTLIPPSARLLIVGCALLLVALIATCIRDIIRRRWSLASKGFVLAWFLCSLYGMFLLD